MKRREFSMGLAVAGLTTGSAAHGQDGGPIEGKHYVRVSPALPAATPGKIEIVEFFWYGCPHCYAFEPQLEAWSRALPADVVLKRIPVAFRPEPFATHQRLYYAIESMGLIDKLHRKVFDQIHQGQDKKNKLSAPDQIGEFIAKQGVDKARFMSVFNSFAITTKLSQANKLVNAYRISGVPSIGIQGQFLTDGPMADGMDRALRVTDFLIQKLRQKA